MDLKFNDGYNKDTPIRILYKETSSFSESIVKHPTNLESIDLIARDAGEILLNKNILFSLIKNSGIPYFNFFNIGINHNHGEQISKSNHEILKNINEGKILNELFQHIKQPDDNVDSYTFKLKYNPSLTLGDVINIYVKMANQFKIQPMTLFQRKLNVENIVERFHMADFYLLSNTEIFDSDSGIIFANRYIFDGYNRGKDEKQIISEKRFKEETLNQDNITQGFSYLLQQISDLSKKKKLNTNFYLKSHKALNYEIDDLVNEFKEKSNFFYKMNQQVNK